VSAASFAPLWTYTSPMARTLQEATLSLRSNGDCAVVRRGTSQPTREKFAMRRSLIAIAIVAAVPLQAIAATAYLVGQTTGTSVTGQAINVCTYQYGTQRFQRAYPFGQMCPTSVEVQ
jgi:hypothetical protein